MPDEAIAYPLLLSHTHSAISNDNMNPFAQHEVAPPLLANSKQFTHPNKLLLKGITQSVHFSRVETSGRDVQG